MRYSIYKYELDITDSQRITLGDNGRIISAGLDPHGKLCVWAEVVMGDQDSQRTIRIIGTGNPVDDLPKLEFIDSVRVGPFMWHVYEQVE